MTVNGLRCTLYISYILVAYITIMTDMCIYARPGVASIHTWYQVYMYHTQYKTSKKILY